MGKYAEISPKKREPRFSGKKLKMYRENYYGENCIMEKREFAELINTVSLEGLSLNSTSIDEYEKQERKPFNTTVNYMAEVLKVKYTDLLE
jgi:hypothetical protein